MTDLADRLRGTAHYVWPDFCDWGAVQADFREAADALDAAEARMRELEALHAKHCGVAVCDALLTSEPPAPAPCKRCNGTGSYWSGQGTDMLMVCYACNAAEKP